MTKKQSYQLHLLLYLDFHRKEFIELKKKKHLILKFIFVVLATLIVSFIIYVNHYYHAEDVSDFLRSSDSVQVTALDNGWLFDGSGENSALIFYPGAKVETSAYAPLLSMIAENGIDCFLVDMPFHLSIFGANKASDIMSDYAYVNWYLAGHSLGGAMAANFASQHINDIDGLILLASYSTKDLSNATFPVLSIYGSEDKILNMENVKKSRELMPEIYGERILNGGNHAYFGSYGEQKGDGTATIPHIQQWQETVDYIISILMIGDYEISN